MEEEIMGLDINKILTESIQETLKDAEDKTSKMDPNAEDKVDDKDAKTDGKEGEEEIKEGEEDPLAHLQHAVAPAISAGLGALTLRNKLRKI